MNTLLEWFNPLVHLTGLVVAVWAYFVSRKRGYILVALYFLLAVVSLTIIPSINKARHRQWQAEHSVLSAADEAYLRELRALDQKYSRSYATAGQVSIPIPLGAALLVAGIWLLANDNRKKVESSAEGVNDN